MSAIGSLIAALARSALGRLFIRLSTKEKPVLTIGHELIDRLADRAVIRLKFHPSDYMLDVTRIAADGCLIQAARVERRPVYNDPRDAVMLIMSVDVYNPRESGHFMKQLDCRVRLMPNDRHPKNLDVGVEVEEGVREVTLLIYTDDRYFPQRLVIPLD